MIKLHNKVFITAFFISSLALLTPVSLHANIFKFDYNEFANIPVLDQGRIKPLDTFARSFLEGFNGKDSIEGIKAIEWLAEMLFDPGKAYRRKVFNVSNSIVINALELQRRKRHRYSFIELSEALAKHYKALQPIFNKPKEELTLEQRQLLLISKKVEMFAEISRSLSLLFPDFKIPPGEIADALGVAANTRLTYVDMRKKQEIIKELFIKAYDKSHMKEDPPAPITPVDKYIAGIAGMMAEIDQDNTSQILRIIPPQWENSNGLWFSPWSVSLEGQGSPKSAKFLKHLEELTLAYRNGNAKKWSEISRSLREYSLSIAGSSVLRNILSLEVSFNRWKLFTKSLVCYILSFLIIMAGFMFWPARMRKAAFLLLGTGFFLHALGISFRMMIMGCPPVTNLYESIVFVGLISVLFGMILEWQRKNGIGIIIATSLGCVLHFLGFKYNIGTDTMGMLSAVLDTNFWLATHVVTITIGYGSCLVGGVIGHVYLLYRLFKPLNCKSLLEYYRNMRGVSFVALFFSSLGTILGGIWADQSWGRFWGWDPKENGALLIVLWLIWLIHGTVSGKIKELGFSCGMVLTNVIVALAWFGVNLLNVGLHSYGFTQGAALNLVLFCGFELMFALGMYFGIIYRGIRTSQ